MHSAKYLSDITVSVQHLKCNVVLLQPISFKISNDVSVYNDNFDPKLIPYFTN